ncbi:hypothetical protein H1C71_040696 [Ictidomys tridecemlineatus]|nr:hypothetical protein H1C71_040696 [Ictidomys tridecemlineatus]
MGGHGCGVSITSQAVGRVSGDGERCYWKLLTQRPRRPSVLAPRLLGGLNSERGPWISCSPSQQCPSPAELAWPPGGPELPQSVVQTSGDSCHGAALGSPEGSSGAGSVTEAHSPQVSISSADCRHGPVTSEACCTPGALALCHWVPPVPASSAPEVPPEILPFIPGYIEAQLATESQRLTQNNREAYREKLRRLHPLLPPPRCDPNPNHLGQLLALKSFPSSPQVWGWQEQGAVQTRDDYWGPCSKWPQMAFSKAGERLW